MASNEDLIVSLRRAVELSPDDVALRVHLGRLLLLSGDVQGARDQAIAASEHAPDDEEASELLEETRKTSDPAEQGRTPAAPETRDQATLPVQRDVVTLDDVAGLEDVKKRLQTEFLAPARNPELAAKYGKTARGGLLLFGPPGCGKTFLARALAGELDATFMAVDSATVVSAFPGHSAKTIQSMFEEARRRAPSLLFFDEVDAVAPKRSSLRDAGWLKCMVNQFLAELDGFADNTGLFVVGATNAPWDVDAAMRRPGRFDRTVAVLPPDFEARREILRTHLAHRQVGEVDYDKLAKQTEGYSGADLVHAAEEAASEAFSRAMETNQEVLIETATLESAIRTIRPSIRPWMEEAKNHVMFANQDGTLDDLATWMRAHKML